MAEKKYVYDVRVNGKCIVNGEGKKSRGTIIKKIIETGEMPGGNHAKSFVTFLAVRLFPAESIEFNMHELHESMDSKEEERKRHDDLGGNVMQPLAKDYLAQLIAKKGLRLSHETLHVLNMYCANGDTFSKSRASIDTLPQNMKEEMECLFKI